MNLEVLQSPGLFSGRNFLSAGILFFSFFKNLKYFRKLITRLPEVVAQEPDREYNEAALVQIRKNQEKIIATMEDLRSRLIGYLLKKNLTHGIKDLEKLTKKYGTKKCVFSNEEWLEDKREMIFMLKTLEAQIMDPARRGQYIMLICTAVLTSLLIPLLKAENRKDASIVINSVTQFVSHTFKNTEKRYIPAKPDVYYVIQGAVNVNDSVNTAVRIWINDNPNYIFPDDKGHFQTKIKSNQHKMAALRFSLSGRDTLIRVNTDKIAFLTLNWTLPKPASTVSRAQGQPLAKLPAQSQVNFSAKRYGFRPTAQLAAVKPGIAGTESVLTAANAEIKSFWIEDHASEGGLSGFRVHCNFVYSNLSTTKLIFEVTAQVMNADSTEHSSGSYQVWLQPDGVSGSYSDETVFISNKGLGLKKGTNNIILRANLYQNFGSADFQTDNGKNKKLLASSSKKDVLFPSSEDSKTTESGK